MKHRRFRPTLASTLVALVFTGLFTALGVWQVQRAAEKEGLAQAFEAQRQLPALDFAAGPVDVDASRYRAATATGELVANHMIYVDNVVLDGRPGYQVFTPLRLNNDRGQILVDRGWIAQGPSRATLPDVPVPTGTLTISGWIDHPRSHPVIVAGEIDPAQTLWPYLDMAVLAQRSGDRLPPLVLHAASDPVAELRQKPPEFAPKTGMHIGYAIQWFAFAAAAVGTYIAVNLKRHA